MRELPISVLETFHFRYLVYMGGVVLMSIAKILYCSRLDMVAMIPRALVKFAFVGGTYRVKH